MPESWAKNVSTDRARWDWNRSVDWYYRHLSRQQPGKAAAGYHVTADDRIVAAWQRPRVGDIIADGPPGTAYYVVRQAEPGKSGAATTPRRS